jgi:acetyl-CoA carboxylase biotin carboxyl carrier protein
VDLKQIKELMAAMRRAGLKRISLKEKTGFEIELECFDENQPQVMHPMIPSGFRDYHPPMTMQTIQQAHAAPHAPQAPHTQAAPAKEETGKFITAPMVGTFYAQPSPDKPSFVKVGDKVDAGTVVCIIEAMKVMNEVKAGVSGTVTELMLSSGQPVEFGTKLFKIV